MREISTEMITRSVRDLCIDANYHLGEDVLGVIKEAQSLEPSPMGKSVLEEFYRCMQTSAKIEPIFLQEILQPLWVLIIR